MAAAVQAQTFTTLADFAKGGSGPDWLIQGTDGNFYGTTGPLDGDPIFKITPSGMLTTVYSFTSDDANSLMQAGDGNFYGTTRAGTIFKLTPQGTLTTLFQFAGPDGSGPAGGLIQAADGNFYGTTQGGGASRSATSSGAGTVFQMTPAGKLTTLHSFAGPDGAQPVAGLVQGTDGNFYGTTLYGGSGACPSTMFAPSGCGTIFKLTPGASLTTLYNFGGTSDGINPAANLIQATDGNFYGTTSYGGGGDCPDILTGSANNGCGTIFKITPEGSFATLYSFNVTDGALPSGLIQATDGNVYGITEYGGTGSCHTLLEANGCGTIFKITSGGSLTTLYSLRGGTGGYAPNSLLEGSDGNLYGTTEYGGPGPQDQLGNGTAFEFSLASPSVPTIASSGGVLNGASFQPGIAPDTWITLNGTNLSSKTDAWSNAIVNGALPTTLDSVSVMVGDQPAYIEYVSATQINALLPGVPAGTLPVTVTNVNGTSPAVMAQVSAEQPAFFQWGTYAVATRQNFSLAVKNGTFPGTTTVPAKPGDVIILWGTGFGPTSPSAPAGVETPSTTTYNTATTVSVTVGKKPATVYGAALAPGYAGLYQIAIQIPALANGDYPVIATITGAQSPSTTMITVQQ